MRRACFERVAGKRTAPPRFLMLKSMICQLWRSLSHCPTLVFTAAPLRRAALRGHGERERAREEEREREREGGGGVGGVSARRALTLIHFHIYTPHVCMSRRRGRRRGKSLVKEWICAQRRASFFFFFSQSQSLVLTAEGNLPAPHPAPRTPERNMKPHSPAAHQVLSQTHTQAES